MSTGTIDTKALIAATPATVALVRRELDKSRESQRGGMQCGIPKAVKVDCAMVERLCRIAEKQADRLAALEVDSLRQQLAAAQAEIECEERRFSEQQDLLHSVIQERDAAQAEARGLRAELARVRELAAKWRAAPQNPDEPLLAIAADELDAAISQPAEQHDPLAVSDHCPECSEPEPECVCGEQPDEHGFKVIPRTADMPEGAKYRLTWIMQADAAGGDVEYTDSLPLALEANRSGAVSERIEDYRPAAQESGDASD